MKRTLTIIAPLAILLFGSSGCKSDKDDVAPAPKTIESTTQDQANDEDVARERSQFVDGLQQKLREIDEDLDDMGSRVDSMSEDAQERTREAYDDLKEQRERVGSAIERTKSSSASEWSQIKRSLQSDLSSLTRKYNALLERMKTDAKMEAEPSPNE